MKTKKVDQRVSKFMKDLAARRWGKRPRCKCGAMTKKRAKARGHHCEEV